jgi:5-methylcytosine-specific restriction protein A
MPADSYPVMAGQHKHKPLYNSRQWKALRRYQLMKEPLCCYCRQQGYVTSATVVDHIQPHRGDRALFMDPKNLQSLCETHHNSAKQKEEIRGESIAIGKDGWPI